MKGGSLKMGDDGVEFFRLPWLWRKIRQSENRFCNVFRLPLCVMFRQPENKNPVFVLICIRGGCHLTSVIKTCHPAAQSANV